ncbi:MAG: FAD-dependent oxidoreductase [Flavobacteriales bacterium]|nr:FAD-dependent oxidoreductase [Flavobacteriales bacterium]
MRCTTREKLPFPITMNGANAAIGHALRDGMLPAPSATTERSVVIVGAGIAGLSAARALAKAGLTDFILLDLESGPGGNSRAGSCRQGDFPLGAHYLPLPDPADTDLMDLMRECGACVGEDENGIPIYRDDYLCSHPQERLFHQGAWRSGVRPRAGLTAEEAAQFARFDAHVARCAQARDARGKWVFTVPMADMSQAVDVADRLDLDDITFAEWLDREGLTCAPLRWYLDYCCLDDYGADAGLVSAFAGLHYFASRRGVAANAEHGDLLTWPDGNGFLVKALNRHAEGRMHGGQLVHAVRLTGGNVAVDVYDVVQQRSHRFLADQVIMAVPRFIAGRLLGPLADGRDVQPHYAPWVVVNLALDAYPEERGGEPMAWDNVIHRSRGLGYVNSSHQVLDRVRGPIITHYRALATNDPAAARRAASERSAEDWVTDALDELRVLHPDIDERIVEGSVALWGHGMVIPVPGEISGEDRRRSAEPIEDRIHFAHSDLSGISIFEEAFHHGNRAAREVLEQLKSG